MRYKLYTERIYMRYRLDRWSIVSNPVYTNYKHYTYIHDISTSYIDVIYIPTLYT